jgi:hypothetical protein
MRLDDVNDLSSWRSSARALTLIPTLNSEESFYIFNTAETIRFASVCNDSQKCQRELSQTINHVVIMSIHPIPSFGCHHHKQTPAHIAARNSTVKPPLINSPSVYMANLDITQPMHAVMMRTRAIQ